MVGTRIIEIWDVRRRRASQEGAKGFKLSGADYVWGQGIVLT